MTFKLALYVFDVFLVAMHRPDAYGLALWLKLIPLTLVLGALIRLWRRQRTFEACLNNLSNICGRHAAAVAYRLTDKET